MADFTSTGWVAGETVTVGAVSATPPGATGSTVDSDVASVTGAASFTGLVAETDYRATGGTSGRSVRFRTGVPPVEGAALSVVITGDPTVGEVLTATVSAEVTSPAYQWQRGGSDIVGATSATYTVRTADIDQEVTCEVDGSVSVESEAVIGVAAPEGPAPDEIFPGFVAGRTYSLLDDDTDFVITNYEELTPGEWTLDDSAATGRILTVDSDIAACEVLVRVQAVPQGVFSVGDMNWRVAARYQDASNHYMMMRTFADGASWMQPRQRISGSNQDVAVLGGVTTLDRTNVVDDQWIKFQIMHDMVRAKTWFDGDAEPSWLGYPFRYRPTFGYGGSTTTELDNITETGAAGFEANYGGTIKDIQIIEGVPSSENLLLNASLDEDLVDSAGRPLFWGWDPKWNSEVTGIVELTTAVGPDGVTTIPVLRCARSSEGASGDGPEPQQEIYLTGAADNASYTRNRPIPTAGVAFGATYDWSVWVKTVGIANSLVQIGSVQQVNYYSDAAGTGLNVGHSDYYSPLAPDTGSQAWTLVEGTLTVHDNADVVRLQRFMGEHDERATGVVLIAGGEWGPTFTLAA